jgi:hypothetical protein
MRMQVCLSCHTPLTPGTDYCPECGMAISHFARSNIGWSYRFAMAGGKRRKPGELSTFVRLKWLPFALGAVMMGVTLAAAPGTVGVVLAPIVAIVALAACSMFQSYVAAAIEAEKTDLDE